MIEGKVWTMKYVRCLLTTEDGQRTFEGCGKNEAEARAKAHAHAKHVLGSKAVKQDKLKEHMHHHVSSGEIGK